MQSRLDLLTSARTRVSSVASSSSVKRRGCLAGSRSHAATHSSVDTTALTIRDPTGIEFTIRDSTGIER